MSFLCRRSLCSVGILYLYHFGLADALKQGTLCSPGLGMVDVDGNIPQQYHYQSCLAVALGQIPGSLAEKWIDIFTQTSGKYPMKYAP